VSGEATPPTVQVGGGNVVASAQSTVGGPATFQLKLVEEARVYEIVSSAEEFRKYSTMALFAGTIAASCVLSLCDGVIHPTAVWWVCAISGTATLAFTYVAIRISKGRISAQERLKSASQEYAMYFNPVAPGSPATVTTNFKSEEPGS
jgi:hypothetical protein